MTPLRLLVLYRHPEGLPMLRAIERHLHVLGGRGHDVHYVNGMNDVSPALRLLRWDGIVLHTTFLTARWFKGFHVWKQQFDWLASYAGPKLALPQDEYDHNQVLDEWLYELDVSVVFTNFDEHHRDRLYPLMSRSVPFERCLTGYVDDAAAQRGAGAAPIAERPIDVGYRATRLPYHFGSHGQLKHVIGVEAERAARELGLVTDISTDLGSRIVGRSWLEFLVGIRATVGAESGSSVLDRRGEIQSSVARLVAADPEATFAEVSERMPPGWDGERFFALGPRHLEAAATRTAQILVEGSYEGALEPWRHYVPVRRDLSDLRQALETARDVSLLQELADRTYDEIGRDPRYGYGALAAKLERWLPSQSGGARTLEDPLREAARAADDIAATARRGAVRAVAVATTPAGPPTVPQTFRRVRFVALSAAAALRLILLVPELRGLVGAAVARGTPVRLERLLREILHLNTIRKAAATGTQTTPRREGDRLVLTTGDAGSEGAWPAAAAAVAAGEIRSLRWVTEEGVVHDLSQLGRLARRAPLETARVLSFFGSRKSTPRATIGRSPR